MSNVIEGGARSIIPNEGPAASDKEASLNKRGFREGGSKEELFRDLRNILDYPLIDTFFEAELDKEGLLSELEDMGIIPVVENPNPYDYEMDEEAHEKWWEEHPGEGEEFGKVIDEREEVLKLLLTGSILGRTLKLFFNPPLRRARKVS